MLITVCVKLDLHLPGVLLFPVVFSDDGIVVAEIWMYYRIKCVGVFSVRRGLSRLSYKCLIFSKIKEVYVMHYTCVLVVDWVKQHYALCMVTKNVWWYHRGNQKSSIEEQTMQWPNEKGQTTISRILHRKLNIKQLEPHYEPGVYSCGLEYPSYYSCIIITDLCFSHKIVSMLKFTLNPVYNAKTV
jgi:hypothetical protein